eukprot:SAG22_NODE_69_length_22779_cov_71.088139_9_plen_181_part_00
MCLYCPYLISNRHLTIIFNCHLRIVFSYDYIRFPQSVSDCVSIVNVVVLRPLTFVRFYDRPDKRTKVSGHRSPPGPGSLAAGGAVVGHIPAWAAGMPRNGGGRAAADQPAKRSVAGLTVGLRAGAVPRHRAAGAGRGGRWLHGAAGGGAPGRAGVPGGLKRGGLLGPARVPRGDVNLETG